MKTLNKILTLLITFQLWNSGSVAIASEKIQKRPNAVIHLLRGELEANPEEVYPSSALTPEEHLANKQVALEAIQEIREKLQDDSYDLEALRMELIKQLNFEEEMQLLELSYVLNQMEGDKLDQIFYHALENGFYPQTLKLDYEVAYLLDEKREVLFNMIKNDISLVKSATAKKLAKLNRDQLLKELQFSENLLKIKGKVWLTVLIIVLGVIAAGAASWAIISATKKHYDRKEKKMKKKYDDKTDQLEADYAQKEQDLRNSFVEEARLREEGYIWQVCATTTTSKSATCSYDGNGHTGIETCITRCLRNPQGVEVNHVTSCSSAFIPSNCFQANPYTSGFNAGSDDGYDDGYDAGYDAAYRRAYDDAYGPNYDNAYTAAYNNGFDEGYNDGYTDGFNQASFDDSQYDDDPVESGPFESLESDPIIEVFPSLKGQSSVASFEFEKAESENDILKGYKKGYRSGYAYATQLLVNP